MPDFFVARQPIFDRRLQVVGYELLFRDGPRSRNAVINDPDEATAAVLLGSLTEIGLERLVGNRPAWINVSRDFLLSGLVRTLPPDSVVFEILENQQIDDQLVIAAGELWSSGYRLALDDFHHAPGLDSLLPLVDVVKLDLLALGADGFSREVERLKEHNVRVLAEKVETPADYAFCRSLGCDLFQGYFFCRPELVAGRQVGADRLALLELLAALQDPDVELSVIERLLARDIGLSNRLLRYINSAFFGLRQHVRSIRQAVTLLGLENLRRWVALSVFASVSGKPSELTVTALIRARFCELAGAMFGRHGDRSELFTLGLFSVIDALMDAPITELVDQLPFPPDICAALIGHAGPLGSLLECVTALEAGDFEYARLLVPEASRLYLSALRWSVEAAQPLFSAAATAA